MTSINVTGIYDGSIIVNMTVYVSDTDYHVTDNMTSMVMSQLDVWVQNDMDVTSVVIEGRNRQVVRALSSGTSRETQNHKFIKISEHVDIP